MTTQTLRGFLILTNLVANPYYQTTMLPLHWRGDRADFDGFWEQEIEFRRQWDYPPFTHLVLIVIRSAHQQRAEFSAQTLHRRLKDALPPNTTLSEPAPAPLEKSHGNYRFHLMLRTRAILRLSRHLKTVLEKLTFPEDVIVTVDVDAYQLL